MDTSAPRIRKTLVPPGSGPAWGMWVLWVQSKLAAEVETARREKGTRPRERAATTNGHSASNGHYGTDRAPPPSAGSPRTHREKGEACARPGRCRPTDLCSCSSRRCRRMSPRRNLGRETSSHRPRHLLPLFVSFHYSGKCIHRFRSFPSLGPSRQRPRPATSKQASKNGQQEEQELVALAERGEGGRGVERNV